MPNATIPLSAVPILTDDSYQQWHNKDKPTISDT